MFQFPGLFTGATEGGGLITGAIKAFQSITRGSLWYLTGLFQRGSLNMKAAPL